MNAQSVLRGLLASPVLCAILAISAGMPLSRAHAQSPFLEDARMGAGIGLTY
jgi:hypothetical protein